MITMKESLTKFIDEFSKEVFEQTYKFGDETIDDTHRRVAEELSKVEKDRDFWKEKFLYALRDFKFVPGGRITSNAGTGLKGTTYINCFVDGFTGEDQDSMEGIMEALKRQALILKSEGGYGFCIDTIRPRGSFIYGIGNETPGPVKMLDMWDTQSAVITAGSGRKSDKKQAKQKIRKGAQMVTMSCWHPDIEEFITAKQTPGRLTRFNMSVLITDDFMKAVENDDNWDLIFPDYENCKEEYKKYWINGNIKLWKQKNLPVKIYKTIKARYLWDLIMNSTYNRNEPGVLFIDTINRLNNLNYCEHINATNPCGEQILPVGGVCLLGSLNLTQFVNEQRNNWDYSKLAEIIPIAVRMMDNVNDITYVPLESQKEELKNKRRIGLGVLGYGSALMMMKIRYGSDKALKLTDELMSFIANTAYSSSADIAKEKGAFPFYRKEYLNSEFLKRLSTETIEKIKKYGIRNSHLLSIQPTGNSSVFANNVSGGLEPLFMPEYIRTTIFPYPPEGLHIPKNVDFINKTFSLEPSKIDSDNSSIWQWTKEGDENILFTNFNGYVWKFDQNRGLLRETVVKDYAVRDLEKSKSWDKNAEWAATAMDLSIDDHIRTMEVFSKYIDSAMSKTINIANDYPFEKFKDIYSKVYKTGTIKGITTYREGTMTSVLSSTSVTKEKSTGIIKTKAPKRPKELPCDINTLMVDGQYWMVIVGLMNSDPYEVFAFPKNGIHIHHKFKKGKLIKVKKGIYNLDINDGDIILENITSLFGSNEQEALTRMISTALRHGADIGFIVEQLQKSEGTIVSFAKSVARTLKTYISKNSVVNNKTLDCKVCGGKDTLRMQEGCYICTSCGLSKCS